MRRMVLVMVSIVGLLWSATALGNLTWFGTEMTWESTGTLQCEDVEPVDVRGWSEAEIGGDGEASSETYKVYDSAGVRVGTMSCGDGYQGLIHGCEIDLVEVAPGVEEGCTIVQVSGDRKELRCLVSTVGFSTGLAVMTFHGSVVDVPVIAHISDGGGYTLAQCTEGSGAATFEIPFSIWE